jgi:hypothetical protein
VAQTVSQPAVYAKGLKNIYIMSARLSDRKRKLFLTFQSYHTHNVQVVKKDGEVLLTEIAENVQRMLDRKMDAVKVSLKFALHITGFCDLCVFLNKAFTVLYDITI